MTIMPYQLFAAMSDLMCYGLDAEETNFFDLSSRNPIIFRIHHNSIEQGFVATAFHQKRARIPHTKIVSRAQVIHHIVQWSTKDSPWISCTFSLPYVLWELTRRVAAYPEKAATLRISFVDARHPSLASRAILGVEALRGPVPRSSMRNARTAVNCARAFQEVLIYGQIPLEAVLATVPWTKFEMLFRSTHLTYLAYDVDCQSSFRYFCERLMTTLRERDVDQAKSMSVDQSMIILGRSYTEVKDESDLDRLKEIVCDLSRIIFSWPYRHPSYHDKSYRNETLAPVDHAFPHLKRSLLEIIERHPSHRRAAILLRITDLKEEITDFATRSTHPTRASILGSSDLRHKQAVQLHLSALKDILLKTGSMINNLEETLSGEGSVGDISESIASLRLGDSVGGPRLRTQSG